MASLTLMLLMRIAYHCGPCIFNELKMHNVLKQKGELAVSYEEFFKQLLTPVVKAMEK